jgi:hypothetical protein
VTREHSVSNGQRPIFNLESGRAVQSAKEQGLQQAMRNRDDFGCH